MPRDQVAGDDPVLTEALARVIQFERPPSSLFRPRVLWRVLSPTAGWFGSAGPDAAGEPDPTEAVPASGED